MPVRQERIKRIIDEYERTRAALHKLRQDVGKLGNHAQLIAEQGLEPRVYEIVAEAQALFTQELPPTDILTLERYHYRKFARVNDRKRIRLRERRAMGLTDVFSLDDIQDEILDAPAIDRDWRKKLTPEENEREDAAQAALIEAWKKEHKAK